MQPSDRGILHLARRGTNWRRIFSRVARPFRRVITPKVLNSLAQGREAHPGLRLLPSRPVTLQGLHISEGETKLRRQTNLFSAGNTVIAQPRGSTCDMCAGKVLAISRDHGVTSLFSPARMPRYNGAIEAPIASFENHDGRAIQTAVTAPFWQPWASLARTLFR